MKNTRFLIALVIVAVVLAFGLTAQSNTLTSSIQFSLSSELQSAGFSTGKDSMSYGFQKAFANGSGSTQLCDLVYAGSRTLAAGASETLDLYGGLTDKFGSALNFKRVKALYIENTHATATITIGAVDLASGVSTIWSPATAVINVGPYGAWGMVSPLGGFVITDDSADLISVKNAAGAGTTTYKVWIIGGGN